MIKICCRCTIPKAISEFPKAKRGLYGVHSICKACKKIYMQEYCKSGKLKIAKQKYKSTEKGQITIRTYTASENNKRIQKQYRESQGGKANCTYKLAKYRAIQKQAMPIWIDTVELKAVYKYCPKGLEVDHIIPLQGNEVSGLHVPWNLQYLSREQNAYKSNSFDGTYQNDSWRKHV